MLTDAKRLQQVIKNLLSNAFKFTREGRVSLTISQAESDARGLSDSLRRADSVLAFAVEDTGIGIPGDKQLIIFEAFQQADGSTSRKYGGTGLGLAISREIARLLGGEIHLTSAPGRGSTFTLYLPQTHAPQSSTRQAPVLVETTNWPAVAPTRDEDEPPRVLLNEAGDDREAIQPGDRTLLIVENDVAFVRLLVEVAHEANFKTLVTAFGTSALALARQYHPSAVSLDISLPDIDGWRVLERLKNDFETRHIPVKVITTGEDLTRGSALGALSVLAKPVKTREELVEAIEGLGRYVDRTRKYLILVHPEDAARSELIELLAADDVNIVAVPTISAAADWLCTDRADCLVLSTRSEESELEALGDVRSGGEIPLIVYGSAELGEAVEAMLKSGGSGLAAISVTSPERLLDECTLRLHRPVGRMSDRQRQILEEMHYGSRALAGRRVLIVDDDIRNIFALTSILERHDMSIVSAETGRAAVGILDASHDIEVVLMDVMMPEMDGFETTRTIRADGRFKSLPIIAVTAKAMKGDREKCIEAGASDYLAKPVDPEELVAKLRAWLLR